VKRRQIHCIAFFRT